MNDNDMTNTINYMTLQVLNAHYWLKESGRIGKLTAGQKVFTQHCYLENLYRGNGNRAKRRMGIDPKSNTAGPWLKIAWELK